MSFVKLRCPNISKHISPYTSKVKFTSRLKKRYRCEIVQKQGDFLLAKLINMTAWVGFFPKQLNYLENQPGLQQLITVLWTVSSSGNLITINKHLVQPSFKNPNYSFYNYKESEMIRVSDWFYRSFQPTDCFVQFLSEYELLIIAPACLCCPDFTCFIALLTQTALPQISHTWFAR